MKIRNKAGQFCNAKVFWDELLDGEDMVRLDIPRRMGDKYKINMNFMHELTQFKK